MVKRFVEWILTVVFSAITIWQLRQDDGNTILLYVSMALAVLFFALSITPLACWVCQMLSSLWHQWKRPSDYLHVLRLDLHLLPARKPEEPPQWTCQIDFISALMSRVTIQKLKLSIVDYRQMEEAQFGMLNVGRLSITKTTYVKTILDQPYYTYLATLKNGGVKYIPLKVTVAGDLAKGKPPFSESMDYIAKLID